MDWGVVQGRFRRAAASMVAAASLPPLFAVAAPPETAPPRTTSTRLSLVDALDYADANYPAVKAALEEKTAAERGVDVARAAYLPQVNLLWQINRATVNNFTGVLLPQSVIPSISGPVLPQTGRTDWNSGAGVLVDWRALDFGVRRAYVDAARETTTAAREAYELTRIDVVTATADAYLDVLAAEALAETARADVDRLHAFNLAVHVLVDNKLRAGVEAAQADAAEGLGQTRLIAARGQIDAQRATLAKLVNRSPDALVLSDPALTAAASAAPTGAAADVRDHPAALQAAARVRVQEAQLRALDRSYAPQVDLLASASGREGGRAPDGRYLGGGAGLGLGTGNWGVGVQVTLPIGSYPSLHAQQQVRHATLDAEQDRYDQTLGDLTEQIRRARAALTTAQAIAKVTPLALQAAQRAGEQQKVRYRTGLATVVDVTAAESALAQAEGQDAIARLNVWRAWADLAAATGDLSQLRAMLGRP
jgi:outer membrane protein